MTVTISYRLGFDGFGWIDGAPTNRAVRDWLLALEWVQENIAQFGGDPAKVTIAGQSAGGGSVLTLLGMESAQHLFARVFALSSPIPDVSEERARAFAADIANGLGVPNNLEGFRSVSEDQVLAEQKRAFDRAMRRRGKLLAEGLPLGPTVDGDLIPQRTISSLESASGQTSRLSWA